MRTRIHRADHSLNPLSLKRIHSGIAVQMFLNTINTCSFIQETGLFCILAPSMGIFAFGNTGYSEAVTTEEQRATGGDSFINDPSQAL